MIPFISKFLVLQFFLIYFESIRSYDYSNYTALPLFSDYIYGTLNQTSIEEIAVNLGSFRKLSKELTWFASKAKFFTFHTKDNLLLQGYYIPSKLMNDNNNNDNSDNETISYVNIETIVFCAGWTESTIQYAHFVHDLYNQNYSIFSYDLRNQGFSQGILYDDGKVTYVDSFDRYVNDLEDFILEVIPYQLSIYDKSNNYYLQQYQSKQPIFIGLSLSGLISLTLISKKPNIVSDIIVIGPCISPLISIYLQYIISALCYLGYDQYLAQRNTHDDTIIKGTHSLTNAIEWDIVKNLLPEVLKVAGPSFGFLNEMLKASRILIEQSASKIKKNMLILQASDDSFVDNTLMVTFFTNLGISYHNEDNNNGNSSSNSNHISDNCNENEKNSKNNVCLQNDDNKLSLKQSRIIRYHNTYHLLLKEIDNVYNQIINDIFDYLR